MGIRRIWWRPTIANTKVISLLWKKKKENLLNKMHYNRLNNYYQHPALGSNNPIIKKINFHMFPQNHQSPMMEQSPNAVIQLKLSPPKRVAIMIILLLKVTRGKQANVHQVIAVKNIYPIRKLATSMGFPWKNHNKIRHQYHNLITNPKRYFHTLRRSMRASRYRMSRWNLSQN